MGIFDKKHTTQRKFYEAMYRNDLVTMKRKLDKGCDVNGKYGDFNRAALHYAAETNNVEMASLLLGQKANVNIQDSNKWTPVLRAASLGHKDVVKLLVGFDADVNIPNDQGVTCVFYAYKDVSIAEMCVELYNSDVNVRNIHKDTPLHWSIKFSNLAAVRFLVEKGADFNACGRVGITPIHIASSPYGNIDAVRYLVAKGANLHDVDDYGNTCLHWATTRVKGANKSRAGLATVEFLVSEGVLLHQCNNLGKTALDLARTHALTRDSDAIVKYLESVDTRRYGLPLTPPRIRNPQTEWINASRGALIFPREMAGDIIMFASPPSKNSSKQPGTDVNYTPPRFTEEKPKPRSNSDERSRGISMSTRSMSTRGTSHSPYNSGTQKTNSIRIHTQSSIHAHSNGVFASTHPIRHAPASTTQDDVHISFKSEYTE